MVYEIGYAYPTSPVATNIGRGKEGCAYIEDRHYRVLKVFDTIANALTYADENKIELSATSRNWALRATEHLK